MATDNGRGSGHLAVSVMRWRGTLGKLHKLVTLLEGHSEFGWQLSGKAWVVSCFL